MKEQVSTSVGDEVSNYEPRPVYVTADGFFETCFEMCFEMSGGGLPSLAAGGGGGVVNQFMGLGRVCFFDR